MVNIVIFLCFISYFVGFVMYVCIYLYVYIYMYVSVKFYFYLIVIFVVDVGENYD